MSPLQEHCHQDNMVLDGFKERFDVSWFSNQRFTLIFNVSTNEGGSYSCEVATTEGFVGKVWKSKIQVNVVGKLAMIFLISILGWLQFGVSYFDTLSTLSL